MNTELARDHRRHALRAACIVRSKESGRLVGDRTLDVSYSGMCIAAIDDARAGERVELSLQIPGSNLWIQGSGRIERILMGRREGDAGPALGVRVDRMDGLSRVLLASVAQQYPEAAHGRGARRDYAETVRRIDRELSEA